jgi:outer membrane protein TolC
MKNILIVFILFLSVKVNSQVLDDYLKIAVENNSAIKVKNAEFNLEKERVNEVSNFENINVSFGVFALTPETRVGSQIFKVGASQSLPWFGELDAQKSLQDSKAEIKKYDAILSERDLRYQVKVAYYQLYEKEAITYILKDNKEILKIYENMALSALENNKATMSDVLRIRVQKNELHSKAFQNINNIEMLSKNFNRLLQRDINIQLFVTDSLNVLDILISNKSIDEHPVLEKENAKNAIYKSKLDVISKEHSPKISIGLDYVLVDEIPNINLSDNGKDILMPKVSLSIPLFNGKKFSSQKSQILIQEDIVKNTIENKKNQLEMALQNAILNLDNSVLDVVAAQKNKAEIQQAINVDLKAYETGILDYDKILSLQLQKIKYQLMEIEATKNAFIAKSKIDYLTE